MSMNTFYRLNKIDVCPWCDCMDEKDISYCVCAEENVLYDTLRDSEALTKEYNFMIYNEDLNDEQKLLRWINTEPQEEDEIDNSSYDWYWSY